MLPLSETDIQIPFFPERNDDPERTVFTKYDLFSDIRLRSGNQRRASGYGISRRAVHHAAIGSRVEFHILESTECILYLFETPQNICTDRFNKGLELAKESPMLPVVMDMCFPLRLFINGLKMYLNNELLCVEFLKAKQTELYFLLNCYYTLKEIAYFYAPIYRYSQTFRYFVMQNYLKAKDVESFAQLGGYSTTTFRRLFKDTFGEPAYQWMTKKKCLDIQNDLITTNASISEICYKYGFESLSNFSHFCRANFGKSPRAIRNERDENV